MGNTTVTHKITHYCPDHLTTSSWRQTSLPDSFRIASGSLPDEILRFVVLDWVRLPSP